jgi:pilus assembly protein CpaC
MSRSCFRPARLARSARAGATSRIAGGALTVPALTVRRAETTVEPCSGVSFAITGLLQRTSANVIPAPSGLGASPVIGGLFKSIDFQRRESQPAIIVTPRRVRPVSDPDETHAPTNEFAPANDANRILFGRGVAA